MILSAVLYMSACFAESKAMPFKTDITTVFFKSLTVLWTVLQSWVTVSTHIFGHASFPNKAHKRHV